MKTERRISTGAYDGRWEKGGTGTRLWARLRLARTREWLAPYRPAAFSILPLSFLSLTLSAVAVATARVTRAGAPAGARPARRGGGEAVGEGRWRDGHAELERCLKLDARQPEALFALAACCAHEGDEQTAVRHLSEAMEAGFQDYDALEHSPLLAPLRGSPAFKELLRAADARREAFDAQLEESLRETYRDTPFHIRRFASPRIVVVTDQEDRVAEQLAASLAAYEARCRRALFPNGLRHAIVVHAPKPAPGAAGRLPGVFSPGPRTLNVNVAVPAREMLREFVRAVHFDDQAAHGQLHASWLREGVAVLYEQTTPGSGPLLGVVDWRLAPLRTALDTPSYTPLYRLLDRKASGLNPQCTGEARYLLYWLQETGRLRVFYRAYLDLFDEDASGKMALEATLRKPLAAIEREWKVYLRSVRDR